MREFAAHTLDAPEFKDYILPLISLKGLSDVFEDEADRLADEFGDMEMAFTLVSVWSMTRG